VADPRKRGGVRHGLGVVLTVAVCAGADRHFGQLTDVHRGLGEADRQSP
jgi:hypothetical protein